MSVTLSRGEGFPRHNRLLKPDEFTRVFRTGVRSSDRFFTLLAAPGELAEARIGLAVSRKVSTAAVERNRIKRLARESFRRAVKKLPAIDIVVMAKRDAASAPNDVLRRSLDRHWQQLGRKCAAS